jgi:hypothetical protein
MAWTTPPTFVADDPLAAADLNILGDDLEYLKAITDGLSFSAVRVTRVASTTVPNNAWTAVSFSAETYDYGSWWSSGTNVVVPAAAIPAGSTNIALLCQVRSVFAPDSVGYRGMRILLNGTPEISFTSASFATDNSHIAGSAFIVVEAGDILTVERFQNSGSGLAGTFAQFDAARYAIVS